MLDLNLSLLVLTLFIFLGMIFLLNNIFYKPMLNFMDERDAIIKKDEADVAKNCDDMQKYMKEIDSIMLSAKDEAMKIRQNTLNSIKANYDEKIKLKKDELEKDYDIFMDSLEEQRNELKQHLSPKLEIIMQTLNTKMTNI